jgi:hypothetical protein
VVVRRAATTFALALLALAVLPAAALAAAAPTIEHSTPSPIRNHEATLRFSIDPEGLETSYETMYGTEAGNYHPFHEPIDGVLPAGDEPVLLEKKIPVFFEAALQPGTEYHWRVVARNAEGETIGTDQVFTTTDGPKPIFGNGEATQTGPTSVGFSGTVDPEGAPLTGCRFRYVDKVTFIMAGFEKWAATEMVRFGTTVPCEESLGEIGSGTEPVTVHGEATGLEPGEYVFRVEGENAYEDSVPVGGVPFTVSADFGAANPPPGPPFEVPGPPAEAPPVRKPCPPRHAKKHPARAKKHHGKKRGHAKKHGRGKACGHFKASQSAPAAAASARRSRPRPARS